MIDRSALRRPTLTILPHRIVALVATLLLGSLLAGPVAGSTATDPAGTAAAGTAQTSGAASATTAGTQLTTTTTTTSTATTMASELLTWLNRDRVAAGLRPLQPWPAMASIAMQRSANMASSYTLSHAAAGGDPGVALSSHGLQWYSFGEIIGQSSYPWGTQAASNLYAMWKSSPLHHAIMFSATFNYIGVGVARAGNGSTYSSILFSESVDHTRPWARNGALTVSGTTVRFYWSGGDVLLQTHTAGLRSFDVLYRVDGGTWHLIRNDTTATSLRLWNAPRRHYYSFKVQSADRRGNLSAWTAEKRIWVP